MLARGEVALSAEAYEQARQAAFETWLTEARTKYNVVTYDTWRSIVPDDPAAPWQLSSTRQKNRRPKGGGSFSSAGSSSHQTRLVPSISSLTSSSRRLMIWLVESRPIVTP